jgi:hypothetical protein
LIISAINDDIELALVKGGAVPVLVAALQANAAVADAASAIAAALSNLSANAGHKDVVAGSGAVPLLVPILTRHSGSADAVRNACNALRNICGSAKGREATTQAGGVDALRAVVARSGSDNDPGKAAKQALDKFPSLPASPASPPVAVVSSATTTGSGVWRRVSHDDFPSLEGKLVRLVQLSPFKFTRDDAERGPLGKRGALTTGVVTRVDSSDWTVFVENRVGVRPSRLALRCPLFTLCDPVLCISAVVVLKRGHRDREVSLSLSARPQGTPRLCPTVIAFAADRLRTSPPCAAL